MAGIRKRQTALARRRRLDDEESRSVATEGAEDSQSDISVPSDVDEDADADNSDLSEVDSSASLTDGKAKRKANGSRDAKPRADVTSRRVPSPPIARSDATFTATKDTEIMLNGLTIVDKPVDDEVMDFETGQAVAAPAPAVAAPDRSETFAERKRREHEEYKKKRDSDPAFIPNRGAFFMHDQRSASAQNGFRQFGGRGGRGGGGFGGPFAPAAMRKQASEATDSPWQHDLHEVVNEANSQIPSSQHQPAPTGGPVQQGAVPPQQYGRGPAGQPPRAPQTRNFSTTRHTHNALVRVFLPTMKEPILFQNVPIKQHTRLPNHRPPLRRDKPVRISLPPSAPRYIFPSVERSFIFIPRALRPNQQGFGRGRGRGFGSFGGGFSSRRTSAYGGSVYSPSVAMSRRSSMAREMGRDSLVSPAGSIMSRGGYDPSRPVVRLPPGGPKLPTAPPIISPQSATPSGGYQQPYPLPQKPTFRENWQGQIPMHQPRPQKTVSVAGIESPASMTFNPPQQQEQQPFHQQIPAHANGGGPPAEPQQFYHHTRQPSFPTQTSTGTPLSNIPERAIHAPAFQPFQPGYQPQNFAVPPGYYYPQNGTQPPYIPSGGMVPMFVPGGQQNAYVMPMAAPPAPAAPAPAPVGQPNTVAYEQNGMTYYVDPSQLPSQMPSQVYAPPMEYPQASYAVPGMGGMMTPGPDGAYYYPQQMQPAPFFQPQ
ncbi:hypothetical protein N0V90_007179 [Kalmusia sp. IMI 367209]|nr:hypothetical protein N0V90_007179 [Kalmusia sp. IMI 367209]